MRIIAGTLKRRTIHLPLTISFRPTMDRVRQRIFDLLTARTSFEDAVVLDLFSGSGLMGFEAISRGASKVVFVEKNQEHASLITENAKKLNVSNQCEVHSTDVLLFLKNNQTTFDFIFADPPYNFKQPSFVYNSIIENKIISSSGYFIFEYSTSFPETEQCKFSFRAGKTNISFFQSDFSI